MPVWGTFQCSKKSLISVKHCDLRLSLWAWKKITHKPGVRERERERERGTIGSVVIVCHLASRTTCIARHHSFFFFWKKNFFNVYLFSRQRETEHEQGRVRERGRHGIWNRLQALSCQHRARRGARTCEPRDHDPSRSRTLNRLSHPGAPKINKHLKNNKNNKILYFGKVK